MASKNHSAAFFKHWLGFVNEIWVKVSNIALCLCIRVCCVDFPTLRMVGSVEENSAAISHPELKVQH